MMDANVGTLVAGLMAGGGLLAMWIVARWPRLEPPSFKSASLAFGAGILTVGLLGPAISVAGANGGGAPGVGVALFVVVLPCFTFICLSALWLLRMLVRASGLR